MNPLAKVVLVGCAALILALGACTACVVGARGAWSGVFSANDVEAKREEEHALAIARGGTLTVQLPSGEVRVRPATGESARLKAVIRAWAEDGEKARANLDHAKLTIEDGTAAARIALDRGGADRSAPISADLDIELPPGIALEIDSGTGSIEARGDFSRARLETSHGSIQVEGVAGDLAVRTSSGSVEVARVDGQHCRIEATHGSISLSSVRADDVHVESASGRIGARDVTAKTIELSTTHGSIQVDDAKGALHARSASGSIRADGVVGETIELASTHGSIDAQRTQGALTLESASGRVAVARAEGALRASTTHGSVQADGVFPSVSVEVGSGSVRVVAREGSRLQSDWKLASTHGSVTVELPRQSAFDLDARSDHGRIDVGFETVVPPSQDNNRKSGSVNGGGKKLSVTTGSGSISIRPLD